LCVKELHIKDCKGCGRSCGCYEKANTTRLPVEGYIAYGPSRRVVRVEVSECHDFSGYPLKVICLERTMDFAFNIADLSLITLYRTREIGVGCELAKLLNYYAKFRRALRTSQKEYKAALKAVQEYKSFGELHTPLINL